MQDSQTPDKIPLPWASSAGGGYIETIPTASQIGITPGRASFTDGFVPLNFVALASGGVGPLGKDFNGILKQITAGLQWQQAGGPILFDSGFSAAIGGYPAGAIIVKAGQNGRFWYNQTDNNTSNPDAGGAGWIGLGLQTIVDTATTYYVDFATGSDVTGNGLISNPYKTLQHAFDTLNSNIVSSGVPITITQNGPVDGPHTDTTGLIIQNAIKGATILNVVINGAILTSATAGIFVTNGGVVQISGTGSVRGASFDVVSTGNSVVQFQGVTPGACSTAKLLAQFGATIRITGDYTDSGNAARHWDADFGGLISVDRGTGVASTITTSGTPAYGTAFAQASTGSVIRCTTALTVFAGSGATGVRYLVDKTSGIDTGGGGASFIPGNAGGTADAATFGWYA